MKKVIGILLLCSMSLLMYGKTEEKEEVEKALELVFILDRSGSMSGLEKDTIGGFNSMLAKQKEETQNIFVTTVLFDDQYEKLHQRIPITEVKELTEKDYFVLGSTALLDAIGRSIVELKKELVKEKSQNRVLFVIITDGQENASQEYSARKIQTLIKEQKKQNWDFLFLGANIDAISTAKTIGIEKKNAVNYHADSQGTAQNFEGVYKAVQQFRQGNIVEESWKEEIQKDYESRK